jgi:hypothetical protein
LAAEILNFIAVPLVIAVVQFSLFMIILKRAGLSGWTAYLSFVQVLWLIGIYISGGWMALYEALASLPMVIPLVQLVMVVIGFVPLFVLAFARWPFADHSK